MYVKLFYYRKVKQKGKIMIFEVWFLRPLNFSCPGQLKNLFFVEATLGTNIFSCSSAEFLLMIIVFLQALGAFKDIFL
jgi:hypothetical protein